MFLLKVFLPLFDELDENAMKKMRETKKEKLILKVMFVADK